MDSTTFELKMPVAKARELFGSWRCRLERLDKDFTNIVFFSEDEWKKFEEYADANNIEYRLV